MNKRVFAGTAGIVTALLMAPAAAGGLSLGAVAGTPGLGAELAYAFNDHLALRAGGYAFNYSYDGEESGINYDSDLELRSGALYLDWHPLGGVFTISAGVFANGNELQAVGVPQEGGDYDIGGTTFTAAQVGTLAAAVDFNSAAPYLGLGWRSHGGEDGGFGFSVDLGVLLQGSPDVELTSSGGTLSGNPLLEAELAAEEQDLENEVDQFEFYPVLGFGVSYTF